jgi:glycosyltransferase involved in cell wall biosynthesis
VPVIADLHDKMTDPRELTGLADRLLSCGEGVRRFAVEGGFPPERVVLIPIPFERPPTPSPAQVGAARQRYGLGADPYLLFVGDITYNKGVYELLEGYRRWRSEHPDVRLVLAGTNREGERFLGQIDGQTEIAYLGHAPHGDVLPLMRGAEMVVLPSRSEGLPRVILEALAVGTRVLCPPGIPEFQRHLSHWVLPRVHADDVSGMLERIWRDPQVPSYPFSEHGLELVVAALAGVYGTLEGGSH